MTRVGGWVAAVALALVPVVGLDGGAAAQEAPPPPPGAFTLRIDEPTPATIPFGQEVVLQGVAGYAAAPVGPLRYVALIDAGATATGFGCGTTSALGCEVEALRDLLADLANRGNAEVAVVVASAGGHRLYDPPGGVSGAFDRPEVYVGALSPASLETSTRPGESISPHAELARLLSGTGERRGVVITPGGPDYGFDVSERDALVATGAPIDGIMVPAGVSSICGGPTGPAQLAAATGGTCRSSEDVPDTPVLPTVVGVTVSMEGSSRSAARGPSGAWAVTFPPRTGNMRAASVIVTATLSNGLQPSASRTVRIGSAPTVDLGVDELTLDEGASHRFAPPVVTDADLGESFTYLWSPAARFDAPGSATPSYLAVDEGDEVVSLRVTDAHAGTATALVTMHVRNVAPTIADVQAPASAPADGPTRLSFAVTDPGALDVVTTTIDWGDGSTSTTTDADVGADHQYDEPGLRLITITASDDDGGTTVAHRAVLVVDATAPTFDDVPDAVVVEATGPDGGALDYQLPSASDGDDPTVDVTCTPPPGSTAPLGTSSIACTAVDGSGNEATTSIPVEVRDTTPPVLAGVPADVTVRTGPGGTAVLQYSPPTATDLVDPAPGVSCQPPPGAALAVGEHVVRCTAVDASGNEVHDDFTVTVVQGLQFVGFDHPVDRGVWNVVRAGRVVPLKWRVLDAAGASVTDLGAVTAVRWTPLTCNDQQPSDPVEVTAAGATSLRVESTGRFVLNWQAPSRPGCGRITVLLADGTSATADFRLV